MKKTVTIGSVKNPQDFYHHMCELDGERSDAVVVFSAKNIKKTKQGISFDFVYGMGLGYNIVDKRVKSLKFKCNEYECVDREGVVDKVSGILEGFAKTYGVSLSYDLSVDVIEDFISEKVG